TIRCNSAEGLPGFPQVGEHQLGSFAPSMNLHRRSGSLASWLLLAILALSIPVVGAEAADTWQTGDGYRFMSLTVSTSGHAGFSLQSSTVTGLLFTNRLSESMVASNRLLELG